MSTKNNDESCLECGGMGSIYDDDTTHYENCPACSQPPALEGGEKHDPWKHPMPGVTVEVLPQVNATQPQEKTLESLFEETKGNSKLPYREAIQLGLEAVADEAVRRARIDRTGATQKMVRQSSLILELKEALDALSKSVEGSTFDKGNGERVLDVIRGSIIVNRSIWGQVKKALSKVSEFKL